MHGKDVFLAVTPCWVFYFRILLPCSVLIVPNCNFNIIIEELCSLCIFHFLSIVTLQSQPKCLTRNGNHRGGIKKTSSMYFLDLTEFNDCSIGLRAPLSSNAFLVNLFSSPTHRVITSWKFCFTSNSQNWSSETEIEKMYRMQQLFTVYSDNMERRKKNQLLQEYLLIKTQP